MAKKISTRKIPISKLTAFTELAGSRKSAASHEDLGLSWDVFVSHASEDKEAFVRPLSLQLKKYGLQVWYDEFSLRLGDSLSSSIDKGLSQSRYGLIVLSPNFFRKKWTQRELGGLVAREVSSGKLIIPVWLGVSREDVIRFSPTLADKFSLVVDKGDVGRAANELLKVIRPDIYSSLLRRAAIEKTLKSSKKVSNIRIKDLKKGPIRHQALPRNFLIRMRIVVHGLREVVDQSEKEWIDNFKRDLQPFHELEIWEIIYSIFQDATTKLELSREQKKAIFRTLLMLTSGYEPSQAFEDLPVELHELVFKKTMSFFTSFEGIE